MGCTRRSGDPEGSWLAAIPPRRSLRGRGRARARRRAPRAGASIDTNVTNQTLSRATLGVGVEEWRWRYRLSRAPRTTQSRAARRYRSGPRAEEVKRPCADAEAQRSSHEDGPVVRRRSVAGGGLVRLGCRWVGRGQEPTQPKGHHGSPGGTAEAKRLDDLRADRSRGRGRESRTDDPANRSADLRQSARRYAVHAVRPDGRDRPAAKGTGVAGCIGTGVAGLQRSFVPSKASRRAAVPGRGEPEEGAGRFRSRSCCTL